MTPITFAITRSLSQLRIQPASAVRLSQATQIRTKITKAKRHRLLKQQRKGPKPLPPKYIPVDKPIIIAPTATYESLALEPDDQRLPNILSQRSEKMANDTPPLRFHFTNLEKEMSPKLRQMFQLTNGSTSELAKAQKGSAMKLFEMRPGDTGSSAVQIMALTSRIQQVQNHVSTHRKDYSGKRGLDALYVKRRKLLDYLEVKDFETYSTVVKSLGLVR
eukprot:783265_1